MIRSRAVFLPRACCFSTAASDPACTASSIRWVRSASFRGLVAISALTLASIRRTLAIYPTFPAADRAPAE